MKKVINTLFPELNNYSEASKNFLIAEDQFVKSLAPIQSFEGNGQNMYHIRTFPCLNQKVGDIASVLDDGNQAISCVNVDLVNLESVFNKFQTKKIDKLKYDDSYKRSLKRSEEIQEILEKKSQKRIEDIFNNETNPELGSKQEKFDQEFNSYQKEFIQGISNIVCEISAAKLRADTNLTEIGANFTDKISPIEIYHRQTIQELKQEMKSLQQVIDSNKDEGNVEIRDDEDDGFAIVQDKKNFIDTSDIGEEEEDK